MPKTKGQVLVFGILMSVTMAYGMEVYNVALKSGALLGVKLCSRKGDWRAAGCRPYDPPYHGRSEPPPCDRIDP